MNSGSSLGSLAMLTARITQTGFPQQPPPLRGWNTSTLVLSANNGKRTWTWVYQPAYACPPVCRRECTHSLPAAAADVQPDLLGVARTKALVPSLAASLSVPILETDRLGSASAFLSAGPPFAQDPLQPVIVNRGSSSYADGETPYVESGIFQPSGLQQGETLGQ